MSMPPIDAIPCDPWDCSDESDDGGAWDCAESSVSNDDLEDFAVLQPSLAVVALRSQLVADALPSLAIPCHPLPSSASGRRRGRPAGTLGNPLARASRRARERVQLQLQQHQQSNTVAVVLRK